MARILIVPAGLILAFVTALLALGIGLGVLAATTDARTGLGLLTFAAIWGASGGPMEAMRSAWMIWEAAIALGLAPVALAALLGEVLGLREPVYYAGLTGLVTAAVPTLVRAILDLPWQGLSAAEGRLTLLLFLVGVASGGLYWLVAGRGAGTR